MITLKYRTALYAVLHFLTDFLCAVLVTGFLLGTGQDLWTVFLYNFFAFAVQIVCGAVFDSLNISSGAPIASFFILTLACMTVNIPVLSACVAGIGNCLFHVGAGRDLLRRDQEHCTLLGVFICPGAAGIFFGVLAGSRHILPLWSIILFSAMGACAAYFNRRGDEEIPCPEVPQKASPKKAVIFCTLCMLAVVILRSYMGAHQDFAWKETAADGFALMLALVLGKAAGGIFADRMGMKRLSAVSLLTAAVFFGFSGFRVLGLAAVFLFNMTMPVTMRGTSDLMPGLAGTSFGLLSFGLFIGYFTDSMLLHHAAAGFAFPIAASLVSLVLLVIGLSADPARQVKGGKT